ncbi:cytochrome c family protein [bacterium]|nr:cytochrome c family protein [bacterium]
MNSRILTIILAISIVFAAIAFLPRLGAMRLQAVDTGYQPEQPIHFSHRLHAGELNVDCLYCHAGAERSRMAGIPAANVCMNCHKFVPATIGAIRAEEKAAGEENRDVQPVVSPEIEKLYRALALDNNLVPDSSMTQQSIRWTQVHTIPDFVYFDHSAHVSKGVQCQTCHGAVETMEVVRQESTLSMGWCVNCHRSANEAGIQGSVVAAPLDCSACHY